MVRNKQLDRPEVMKSDLSALEVRGLTKRFDRPAVDALDLDAVGGRLQIVDQTDPVDIQRLGENEATLVVSRIDQAIGGVAGDHVDLLGPGGILAVLTHCDWSRGELIDPTSCCTTWSLKPDRELRRPCPATPPAPGPPPRS